MKQLIILISLCCATLVAGAKEYLSAAIDSVVADTSATYKTAKITGGCIPATSATDLDINNVKALINSGGDMWWDLQGNPKYEVPNGSGKTAIFAGALWMGGQDVSGQLKVAAQRYRSNGNDFWPGPIDPSTGEVSAETCKEYDRHFISDRSEVEQFVAWYKAGEFDAVNGTSIQAESFPDYEIPEIVKNWPAFDANTGEYLAPFYDANGDGAYNYMDGDYPGYAIDEEVDCSRSINNIFGDRNLWWVFNDKGNIHTESNASAIGLEIRAQAFGFATNDEVNNMTFYNYEIVNRSTFTLTETYFGQWVDVDLGNPLDDFVGCDVSRGLGYCYNGDDFDEDNQGASGYGSQPAAIGVDFFQGPFQDEDGVDNAVGIGAGESLNGVGYGDGEVDNERIGMRRFLYHNNDGSVRGDPNNGTEYYNYLRGIWRDGSKMVYGGTGHNSDPDATDIQADFMFPGDTDPLGWGTDGVVQEEWTEETSNNTPFDRRFIQSAGPFTLQPGAINNITVGVVWAQASAGGPFASVEAVRSADDKTQALFDNCFKVLDGPDAPELTVQELDQELILYLSNPASSNNYNESYSEVDVFQSPPDSVDHDNDGVYTQLSAQDKIDYVTYNFQGYQIFQVKNASVSAADLHDPDKARLVAQCDIKDGVTQIINFEKDADLGVNVPIEEVNGSDAGIKHSFKVTEDLFATGDRNLVNFKQVYYMAIAYAYNGTIYNEYDPNDPNKLEGQTSPYLGSRKSITGAIRPVVATPHKPEAEAGGTDVNAAYGDGFAITRLEGTGNGGNILEISSATIDEILESNDHYSSAPSYVAGAGPIAVKVVDPVAVPAGQFTLQIMPGSEGFSNGTWKIWMNGTQDTVFSVQSIDVAYEQLIALWGISIEIAQASNPRTSTENVEEYANDFLSATLTFDDPYQPWLAGLEDSDNEDPSNWIRSGTRVGGSGEDPTFDDYFSSYIDFDLEQPDEIFEFIDEREVYENLLKGTWSPYVLASIGLHGPVMDIPLYIYGGDHPINEFAYYIDDNDFINKVKHLAGVDLVFTNDKSKWTRAAVIETQQNCDLAQGRSKLGFMRNAPSVDKNGNPTTASTASTNESDANYISATGMGWFPGYAINVETGERLNIAFGEDSWMQSQNGRDMLWNPTDEIVEDPVNANIQPDYRIGGKHYIYIFRNNIVEDGESEGIDYPADRMPSYDAGEFIASKLKISLPGNTAVGAACYVLPEKREEAISVWKSCMWVGATVLAPNESLLACDATVKLRVAKPYTYFTKGTGLSPTSTLSIGETYYVEKGPVTHDGVTYQHGEVFKATSSTFWVSSDTEEDLLENVILCQYGCLPTYTFSTDGSEANDSVASIAAQALEMVGVVPNPYLSYASYENDKLDNRVRIINLPQNCTVSIYSLSGRLVRQFEKDNAEQTYIDWDLKNHAGVPIASGLYLIHVDAPGTGEKILKWYGTLRPIDLDSF